MLHGIAELAELASGGDRVTAAFDLNFTRYVEKDVPVLVSVTALDDAHRWRVELAQADQIVCEGTVDTIPLSRASHDIDRSTVDDVLADGTLAHRHRPENIVVTALRKAEDGYAVDYVPSEAVRTDRFEGIHCPLDVIEATRQFMTLMCHQVCHAGLDRHLILGRFTAVMPQLFPLDGTVRLTAVEPLVSRNRLDFTITAWCGTATPAVTTWDILVASPAAYARLRGVGHA
jgi:hypothetical protein